MTVKSPYCVTSSSRQFRPCIVLDGSRGKGFTVLPLATFDNADPSDMDELLHAVVLPIGGVASVHPDFMDRRRFQTDPLWDVGDGAAYIVPQIMVLRPGTPVEPLRGMISPADVVELRELSSGFAAEMVAGRSAEELKSLIESFQVRGVQLPARAASGTLAELAQAYDRSSGRKPTKLLKKKKALMKDGDDEFDEDNLGGALASSQSPARDLDPLESPFVPRSTSTPTDASSDCSRFDAFSVDSSFMESSDKPSGNASTDLNSEPLLVHVPVRKRHRRAKKKAKAAPASGKENNLP
ncbi:hypothetical protein AURDEDRAFT_128332 [Auricularia subglabra TFB-10046 SS5]|nr:hypothetical protein AURDEDRAFT_128332 [Auricularia subglabra TFB-10046 SS5]